MTLVVPFLLADLRRLAEQRDEIDGAMMATVRLLRSVEPPTPWPAIGRALGISTSAARERYVAVTGLRRAAERREDG